VLQERGNFLFTVRRELGRDIAAACGQLKAEGAQKKDVESMNRFMGKK